MKLLNQIRNIKLGSYKPNAEADCLNDILYLYEIGGLPVDVHPPIIIAGELVSHHRIAGFIEHGNPDTIKYQAPHRGWSVFRPGSHVMDIEFSECVEVARDMKVEPAVTRWAVPKLREVSA